MKKLILTAILIVFSLAMYSQTRDTIILDNIQPDECNCYTITKSGKIEYNYYMSGLVRQDFKKLTFIFVNTDTLYVYTNIDKNKPMAVLTAKNDYWAYEEYNWSYALSFDMTKKELFFMVKHTDMILTFTRRFNQLKTQY